MEIDIKTIQNTRSGPDSTSKPSEYAPQCPTNSISSGVKIVSNVELALAWEAKEGSLYSNFKQFFQLKQKSLEKLKIKDYYIKILLKKN